MKAVKIIFKVLIGIGIIYILWAISFVLKPDINDFLNRTEFVKSEWINWEETESSFGVRWNMIHDLTNNYELKGKSKKEITKLLGKPSSESKNSIRYYLGLTGHGINTGYLSFEFENDRVIKFKVGQG